jgi:hypothetical protein
MTFVNVIAAYGRTPQTQAAVQELWDAGKDFQITDFGRYRGSYLNKDDAEREGIKVIVRYGKGAEQGGGKLYQVK